MRSVLCDSLIVCASEGSDTAGEADVSVQTRLVSVTRTLDKHQGQMTVSSLKLNRVVRYQWLLQRLLCLSTVKQSEAAHPLTPWVKSHRLADH